MSSCWDRRIQNPVKDLRLNTLEKQLKFLTIFAKDFIVNIWEIAEYVLGFKYVRVLDIRKFL